MAAFTHVRPDRRQWVGSLADRCQTLVGLTSPVNASAWLETCAALLTSPPHDFTEYECVVARAILTKTMLTLARTTDLAHTEILRLVELVTTSNPRTLCEVLATFVSRLSSASPAAYDIAYSGNDVRVAATLGYIAEHHVDRKLSLGSVARHVGLSTFYTSRLLKRDTGRSFEFHLHWARTRSAQGYLADTSKPIKEIAYLVGYENATQLDRHFKRFFSMTPTSYRNCRRRNASQ